MSTTLADVARDPADVRGLRCEPSWRSARALFLLLLGLVVGSGCSGDPPSAVERKPASAPARVPAVDPQLMTQPFRGIDVSDNSNTQFALLALWAARRHGVPVDRALALVVQRFYREQHQDGGWSYSHSSNKREDSSDTMTCAGLLGLVVGHTLASQDLRAGIEPQIGRKHIRVLALEGFPKASFPGILGEIDSLPMEYRWSTRAILLDPEEARGVLDKTRKKWRSRIRGFKDQILRTHTGAVNLYAQHMSEDAEQAMGVAASGDVQFAEYSTNIICMDDDMDRLHENTRLVMKKSRPLIGSLRRPVICSW